MASNAMINVKPTFEMEVFANKLADTYRSKGYRVNVMPVNGNCSITIEKGTEGLNNLIGLGEKIRVNCTHNDNFLTLSFTDAAWGGKIIALAVGWVLCCIPFITGIMGCIRQSSLPKNIESDAMMIASGM